MQRFQPEIGEVEGLETGQAGKQSVRQAVDGVVLQQQAFQPLDVVEDIGVKGSEGVVAKVQTFQFR